MQIPFVEGIVTAADLRATAQTIAELAEVRHAGARDHEPGRAGITGPGPVASLGGVGKVPSRSDVLGLLETQLRVAAASAATAAALPPVT